MMGRESSKEDRIGKPVLRPGEGKPQRGKGQEGMGFAAGGNACRRDTDSRREETFGAERLEAFGCQPGNGRGGRDLETGPAIREEQNPEG